MTKDSRYLEAVTVFPRKLESDGRIIEELTPGILGAADVNFACQEMIQSGEAVRAAGQASSQQSSARGQPPTGHLKTPEELAEQLVSAHGHESGGWGGTRLAMPGEEPVLLGTHQNPVLTRREVAAVRRFIAAVIRSVMTPPQLRSGGSSDHGGG
jgi:hypothetical protein